MNSWAGRDIDEFGYSKDSGDLPWEYPTFGSCDFREPAFHAQYSNGSCVTAFEYAGYDIFKGKKALKGLPASYCEDDDSVESLEIYLNDKLTGLRVTLSYTAFYDFDVITKNVRVNNDGAEDINIKRIMTKEALDRIK